MKFKSVISAVTAAAMSVTMLAVSVSADTTAKTLSDVVTAAEFTLVSNSGSTDRPSLNSNKWTSVTTTAAYTDEYKAVFGENVANAGTGYVNWFGTSRRGVVSADITVTAEQAGTPYKAYVVLVGGTVVPTVKIGNGDEITMTADTASIGTVSIGTTSGTETKSLYIASCTIGSLNEGTYTVTWGGGSPSDIVAAGFGTVANSAKAAAVGTIYKAADLFSSTTAFTQEFVGANEATDAANYTAFGAPFGELSTITKTNYPNYATTGSVVLKYNIAAAGSYTLNILTQEYDKLYFDVDLDGTQVQDGSTLSGLKQFAKHDSRGITVQQAPLSNLTAGEHLITLTGSGEIGLMAIVLTMDAEPEPEPVVVTAENIKTGGGAYEDGSYGFTSEVKIGETAVDFTGAKWKITNSEDKIATVDAAVETKVMNADVVFGLVLTPAAVGNNTITSVQFVY